MTKKSLAARAGSWSARHRKTAIFGWLGFVVVALVLGGAVGTKQLQDKDDGSGESRAAERVLHESFAQEADEQVLVQAGDAATRRAAVRDVKAALQRFDYVQLEHDTVS